MQQLQLSVTTCAYIASSLLEKSITPCSFFERASVLICCCCTSFKENKCSTPFVPQDSALLGKNIKSSTATLAVAVPHMDLTERSASFSTLVLPSRLIHEQQRPGTGYVPLDFLNFASSNCSSENRYSDKYLSQNRVSDLTVSVNANFVRDLRQHVLELSDGVVPFPLGRRFRKGAVPHIAVSPSHDVSTCTAAHLATKSLQHSRFNSEIVKSATTY